MNSTRIVYVAAFWWMKSLCNVGICEWKRACSSHSINRVLWCLVSDKNYVPFDREPDWLEMMVLNWNKKKSESKIWIGLISKEKKQMKAAKMKKRDGNLVSGKCILLRSFYSKIFESLFFHHLYVCILYKFWTSWGTNTHANRIKTDGILWTRCSNKPHLYQADTRYSTFVFICLCGHMCTTQLCIYNTRQCST